MSELGNKEIMANNIIRLMQEHEKDRNDVCKALGFKYTTFADWVNAKTYPRIDKIELMANYFGVNKSDLVEKPSDNKQHAIPKDIGACLESLIETLNKDVPVTFEGKDLSSTSKRMLAYALKANILSLKNMNDDSNL